MMGNGYYNPYQPYYNGVGTTTRQEVVRVNGRNGADAYQMAPNSSVLLLDETAPIIWLKTTDGASYPTITGYKITPIQAQAHAEDNSRYEALEARIDKIEEVLAHEQKSDVKPTRTVAKQ